MEYLRITQILEPFTGIKYIEPHILENAAVRGTRVHAICEDIATGNEPWLVSSEYQPYVDSFMSWWGRGRKIKAVEKRFFCDDLGISGKIDFIVESNSGLILVDLKTSQQESKSWMLQGSAYSYLCKKNGFDIKKIIFLKLCRNGTPAKEYEYQENMDLFKNCLSVYKYFYGKKGKEYGKSQK